MKTTTTSLVLRAPITPERISQLINIHGIASEIASIDLEMVKMKMQETDEGAGWTDEQCESGEIEYKRFLHLNKLFPKASIVPNKIMDTVWHFHILDTRAYCKDSERVFGGYFHHFPYFGMRGDEDQNNLISSFENTKQLYRETFGESMVRDAHSDCWHDCESRCWHACSKDDKMR